MQANMWNVAFSLREDCFQDLLSKGEARDQCENPLMDIL